MRRMTPISLCIICGTKKKKMVLMAHFPPWAPTNSPLVQSGIKLCPKPVNRSLASKVMGQLRSNPYNSSVNSPIPVGVTVTLAGALETEIVLMLDMVASPECSISMSVLCLELLQLLLLFKPGSWHFPLVVWNIFCPSNKCVSCLIWL